MAGTVEIGGRSLVVVRRVSREDLARTNATLARLWERAGVVATVYVLVPGQAEPAAYQERLTNGLVEYRRTF